MTKKTLVEYEGVTHNGPDLAREFDIPWSMLYQRLRRGWPIDQALTYTRRDRGTLAQRIAFHEGLAVKHAAIAARLRKLG